MPTISPALLLALGRAVFRAMGCAEHEAELVADHLVRSNLAGHDSHGIGVLPGYVRAFTAGLVVPNQTLRPVLDAGALLQFDGGRGFGQRMAAEAVSHAITRARQLGACVMGLRNSAHIGRVGTYAELAAQSGCAFVAFVNAADHAPYQAPFGCRDARLGTNPFCAGVPGADGPALMLDMATTTIAYNKARVAHEKGVAVPAGALIDGEGRPTTDPTDLVERHEGALTSFGLHKGSGLAILCEAMGAVLTGGQRADEKESGGVLNSMLAVVIDTSRLEGSASMPDGFAAVAAHVRGSRLAPGFDAILLPGEPERRNAAERGVHGIPLSHASLSALRGAALQMGVQTELGAASLGPAS